MPPRSRTSAVARAAADLLQQRIHYIEELEAAATAENAALAAVEDAKTHAGAAADHTVATYRAAIEAGWTTTELRQLGYGDRRSARRSSTTAATGTATNSDSTATPAGGAAASSSDPQP